LLNEQLQQSWRNVNEKVANVDERLGGKACGTKLSRKRRAERNRAFRTGDPLPDSRWSGSSSSTRELTTYSTDREAERKLKGQRPGGEIDDVTVTSTGTFSISAKK